MCLSGLIDMFTQNKPYSLLPLQIENTHLIVEVKFSEKKNLLLKWLTKIPNYFTYRFPLS